MKVYKEPCKNCLLSADSIVSPARRKSIIQGCAKKQTHFICHKASMDDKDVCCKTFYDKLGRVSQMIRIMGRLQAIDFIEQPEAEKLMSWREMEGRG